MAFAASSAQAQTPFPYYGLGYWAGPLYNFSNREHLPYYSLFPPVYYSVPVARTYGYSPFAYPPGTMTPDVEFANPKEIINPHVPQESLLKPTSDQTTRHSPKVIWNPYVPALTPRDEQVVKAAQQ